MANYISVGSLEAEKLFNQRSPISLLFGGTRRSYWHLDNFSLHSNPEMFLSSASLASRNLFLDSPVVGVLGLNCFLFVIFSFSLLPLYPELDDYILNYTLPILTWLIVFFLSLL